MIHNGSTCRKVTTYSRRPSNRVAKSVSPSINLSDPSFCGAEGSAREKVSTHVCRVDAAHSSETTVNTSPSRFILNLSLTSPIGWRVETAVNIPSGAEISNTRITGLQSLLRTPATNRKRSVAITTPPLPATHSAERAAGWFGWPRSKEEICVPRSHCPPSGVLVDTCFR